MIRKTAAFSMVAALLLSLAACGNGIGDTGSSASEENPSRALVLSDETVTLDGQEVTESSSAVTVSHDIVYYQAGMSSDYGEGVEADEHTAEEADAHTVVTIREAGTYRVSGKLSAGQLAIDLGDEAKTDPNAVVTVILDGVDITCTVAPALIFYQVYECDTDWVAYDAEELEEYPSTYDIDTSAAGANVVLADNSENNIAGSYVARIYKEGTTKKLHKYDGAFYSKMSMNISGETEGTGVLNIQAANEGLDSELHLTINGGVINIQANNDGINTNEDGVSVTTINGGTIQIDAGLGVEGDGIDSNGHLVINGGNVYTKANESSPDGGIDADGDILINGGYLVALGIRNDAVAAQSQQDYMELSFASTLPAGSLVEVTDPNGQSLVSFTTDQACQSITFTSPDLEQNVTYTLTVDGVIQQYTGNQTGGFGFMGGGFGGQKPEGDFQPPEMTEGQNFQQRPEGFEGQMPEMPDSRDFTPQKNRELSEGMELPEGMERPEGGRNNGRPGGGEMGGQQILGEASTEFTLTDTVHSFSGISDSAEAAGKSAVTFSAQITVLEDGTVSVSEIEASETVDGAHVQLTVEDVPSEDYSASCLWSDGEDAIAAILPEDSGTYRLTIAVFGDDLYTGSSSFQFIIPQSE